MWWSDLWAIFPWKSVGAEIKQTRSQIFNLRLKIYQAITILPWARLIAIKQQVCSYNRANFLMCFRKTCHLWEKFPANGDIPLTREDTKARLVSTTRARLADRLQTILQTETKIIRTEITSLYFSFQKNGCIEDITSLYISIRYEIKGRFRPQIGTFWEHFIHYWINYHRLRICHVEKTCKAF